MGPAAGQTILASYGGTTAFAPSSATQVLGQFATTTAVSSSTSGSLTTLTATVSPDTAGATPAGVVDFYDATTGTELGSATLSGGSGSIVLPNASLPAGDSITVTYHRDNPTISGGGGSDTFFFDGSEIGSPVIDEPANSTSAVLNFYDFGGSVNLSLAASEANVPQAVDSTNTSYLHLTLSNPSAFDEAVGSTAGGTIVAGSGNDSLISGGGLDSLVAGSGNDYLQSHVNQVVYLDFPSADQNPVGDYLYSSTDEAAILAGLQRIFGDFNYTFTLSQSTAQTLSAITGGNSITEIFNSGDAGGSAAQLDWHDLTLNGTVHQRQPVRRRRLDPRRRHRRALDRDCRSRTGPSVRLAASGLVRADRQRHLQRTRSERIRSHLHRSRPGDRDGGRHHGVAGRGRQHAGRRLPADLRRRTRRDHPGLQRHRHDGAARQPAHLARTGPHGVQSVERGRPAERQQSVHD